MWLEGATCDWGWAGLKGVEQGIATVMVAVLPLIIAAEVAAHMAVAMAVRDSQEGRFGRGRVLHEAALHDGIVGALPDLRQRGKWDAFA